ncbi:MAG: hypothetical protein OEX07_02340, partial [Gammaproteobacteria bacterium]|nr:hypothetical protein [Gammaproteobacteria bacterium]
KSLTKAGWVYSFALKTSDVVKPGMKIIHLYVMIIIAVKSNTNYSFIEFVTLDGALHTAV